MKRFITYLYEYENGRKGKNTGFIRVDERKGLANMQISVRNLIRSHEKGKAYAMVKDSDIKEFELGEMSVINGQGDVRFQFSSRDLAGSGYGLEDVVGIGIRFSGNVYLASCWKDEVANEIGRGVWGEKQISQETTIRSNKEVLQEQELLQEESKSDRDVMSEVEFSEELRGQEKSDTTQEMQLSEKKDLVTYQKLELNQIRTLPSKNWYLCNNRFLVHGFWNYKYLVLKKESSSTEEVAYLGVPGVFEKPEMVMATLFGFQEFQTLPVEVTSAQMNEMVELEKKEKDQEPKTGTFGCWLIPLQV